MDSRTLGLTPFFGQLKLSHDALDVETGEILFEPQGKKEDIQFKVIEDLDWLTRCDPSRMYAPPCFALRLTGGSARKLSNKFPSMQLKHWEIPYFGPWSTVLGSLPADVRAANEESWKRVDDYCRSKTITADLIISKSQTNAVEAEIMIGGEEFQALLSEWQSRNRSAVVGYVLETAIFPTHLSFVRAWQAQLSEEVDTLQVDLKLTLFSSEEHHKVSRPAYITNKVFAGKH